MTFLFPFDVNAEEPETATLKKEIWELSFEDITGNPGIIGAIYVSGTTEAVQARGKKLVLELYVKKSEELLSYENIPSSIVKIRSDDKEIILPISSYRPLSKIRHYVPRTGKPILLIADPNGGNCWNCTPNYVISLEDGDFLKVIGKVAGSYDLDKDGVDELLGYDDIWEGGLGYLSHADSPGARIIMGIKDGEIVPDINGRRDYYLAEIERMNSSMEKFPRDVLTESNAELLSLVLQKFLIYRLLGDMEGAWREFESDIRHYDDRYFYLNGGVGKKEIPIDEIIGRMKESLEKKR